MEAFRRCFVLAPMSGLLQQPLEIAAFLLVNSLPAAEQSSFPSIALHICSTSQARPQPTTREITPTMAFQKRGSLGWKTIGGVIQHSSSFR
jgi:hypothetical protein